MYNSIRMIQATSRMYIGLYRTQTGCIYDYTGHQQDVYSDYTGHKQDVYKDYTGHKQDIYIRIILATSRMYNIIRIIQATSRMYIGLYRPQAGCI